MILTKFAMSVMTMATVFCTEFSNNDAVFKSEDQRIHKFLNVEEGGASSGRPRKTNLNLGCFEAEVIGRTRYELQEEYRLKQKRKKSKLAHVPRADSADIIHSPSPEMSADKRKPYRQDFLPPFRLSGPNIDVPIDEVNASRAGTPVNLPYFLGDLQHPEIAWRNFRQPQGNRNIFVTTHQN